MEGVPVGIKAISLHPAAVNKRESTHIHHIACTRPFCLHSMPSLVMRSSCAHPLYERGAIIRDQS